MTVWLSLGPPGSGKTHLTLTRILEVRKASPLAPVWVIAPERLAVAAYRQRLGQVGGALGVRVGTFGDLFQEVLARAARFAPVVPGPVQRLVLRQAIRGLAAEGALPHYMALAGRPGFLEAMAGAIAELDQASVSPESLERVAEDSAPWLGELARIRAGYRLRLGRAGWVDSESLNASACGGLDEMPDLLEDVALVVVDGFELI